MKGKWLVTVWMLMASTGLAQGPPSEQRYAEATWRQTEGCVATVSRVVAVENAVEPSTQYPDGWARDAWLTVEKSDTCQGMQLVNIAGQLGAAGNTVTLDRRLGGGGVAGTVEVFDGVTQQLGTVFFFVAWEGDGAITRQFRAASRGAEATLVVDGLGLKFRTVTTEAILKVSR